MNASTQADATTSASQMPGATTTFLPLMAGALIASMPSTPALAETLTTIEVDVMNGPGAHTLVTQQCTESVCTLPGTAPLPIPYPIATIDATGGVLRGRMRVEADFDEHQGNVASVVVRSSVYHSVMAHTFYTAAGIHALTEGGMITRMVGTAITNSALSVGVACPDSECHNQRASVTSTIGLLRGSGAVAVLEEDSSTLLAGADVAGMPLTDQRQVFNSVSLSAPFEETFGLFWNFVSELQLDIYANRGLHYAENDFSHTLGFTGLRFYDGAGNDVSNWVTVAFDSPQEFISAPVPEPGTYAMLVAGLGLLGVYARRRTPA